MSAPVLDRPIVVGGSIAGLATACALASRAAEVVVVERAVLPDRDTPVSIAPQGTFPHALLPSGAAALEQLAPGLGQDLVGHGALPSSSDGVICHWWAEGQVRHHMPSIGVDVPFCSRALVESRLRAHVLALPNVTLQDQTLVRGVEVSAGRVRSVQTERLGQVSTLAADLVVDASGRASRAATWLADAGVAAPTITRVEVGLTYTAVDVRRHPADAGGARIAMVQNTAAMARIGVAFAVEGERWQIVLGGYFGDAPTPDPDGMRGFARSMPDPVIAELLDNEWLTEPARFRFAASQRRQWRTSDLPAGFCVIGDAVASFNPLYGQGMSAAAQQALALAAMLDRHGNGPALPRRMARSTAKIVANPWQIATGADFVYAQTKGTKPPGTDLINRYMARVTMAAALDEVVNREFFRVFSLLAPPRSLLAPSMVRRVRRATRGHTDRSMAFVAPTG